MLTQKDHCKSEAQSKNLAMNLPVLEGRVTSCSEALVHINNKKGTRPAQDPWGAGEKGSLSGELRMG